MLLSSKLFFDISIHSLRVEGDLSAPSAPVTTPRFQSTPSVWRETLLITADSQCLVISIHSLRVDGDAHLLHSRAVFVISIHAPRVEGDPVDSVNYCGKRDFNPLPPCGGRPRGVQESFEDKDISIHSLRVEGDLLQISLYIGILNFNPLPPCGGRPFGGTGQ